MVAAARLGDAGVERAARKEFSRAGAGDARAGGAVRLLAGRSGFLGGDEKQPRRLRSSGFSLRGHAAGYDAAPVAVEQLEEHINHEVQTKNAKSQEYGERHRCHARTGNVLPPLKTVSRSRL